MKRLIPVLLASGLLLRGVALAADSSAPVFYVSPKGNDSWSGKRAGANWRKTDGPFASVWRAVEAARAWKQQNPCGGVRILLRGGVYFQPEPLVQPL